MGLSNYSAMLIATRDDNEVRANAYQLKNGKYIPVVEYMHYRPSHEYWDLLVSWDNLELDSEEEALKPGKELIADVRNNWLKK